MNEPFLFIAGHPALDFLNTEKANNAGERVELLTTPEALALWFAEVGFGDVIVNDALLLEAHTLRDTIRELVVAWRTEKPAPVSARTVLNNLLATGASYPFLAESFGKETARITEAVHPLYPIADAALHLLTESDKTLARPCAGTGCVLWFLDTTKNKRRRWCRMEACGNREKAAAHYHRQRTQEI